MGRLGNLPPAGRVGVTCASCKRRGSFRVSGLLIRYGPDIETLDLLRALTASCRHQHEPGSGKRRKYVPACLATISEPRYAEAEVVTLPTPGGMPYTIETWNLTGGGIELHLGTLHRLDMAVAAFEVVCALWPDSEVTVRQRALIVRKRERPR